MTRFSRYDYDHAYVLTKAAKFIAHKLQNIPDIAQCKVRVAASTARFQCAMRNFIGKIAPAQQRNTYRNSW